MSMFQQATQVVITGGTHIAAAAGSTVSIDHAVQGRGFSKALRDLSMAVAHAALHDSAARFNAPRCYRNTRARYREQLEQWMLGHGEHFEDKHLIWLHGGAGAGKSAIMQSVSERGAQHGVVCGAFFFSLSDSSRNYAEAVLPTLAYQLARMFPAAMAALATVIDHDPLIFKASLETQAYQLLVRPILHLVDTGVIDQATTPRQVFVIDGLDECVSPQKQALLIKVIASILCEYDVPVRFLIASRPEIAIHQAFQRENRIHDVFATIVLDDDEDARSDIRQFIEDGFCDIIDSHPMRNHISLPWPSARSIENLVWKASGHFIYAVTVMKFIAASDEHPVRALQVIEGLETSRTRTPFAALDALYLHILTAAKYAEHVLAILRHCLLTKLHVNSTTYSVPIISLVQDMAPADIHLFLSDVQALVSVSLGRDFRDSVVKLRHLSLADFFLDEARSQGLYMAPGAYHASLVARFFYLLDTSNPELHIGSTSIRWTHSHKEILIDGANMFISTICEAIKCCRDDELLDALIRRRSPKDIWSFCCEKHFTSSLGGLAEGWPTTVASFSVAKYMSAVRDCVSDTYSSQISKLISDQSTCLDYLHHPFQISNSNNSLYLHQFPMYMQFLLDNLNNGSGNAFKLSKNIAHMTDKDSIDQSPNTVNYVIPALLFSASPFALRSTHHLIFKFHAELGINECHACYLVHIVDSPNKSGSGIDPRTEDALAHLPQSKLSWRFHLTTAMKIILQVLLRQTWKPPFYFINQHERWLKRTKALKHFSVGSPKLSTRFYDYRRVGCWSKPTTRYNYDLPYHHNFPSIHGPHPQDLCNKRSRVMCAEGYDCILLLKAVIFFLDKTDCVSEVAQLARKSLPQVALWFPKLMKRARVAMDQYVDRWEGSMGGLIEKTKSFSIENLD